MKTVVIPQPPSGSCFYHAMLFATSDRYRGESDKRLQMTAWFRKYIVTCIFTNKKLLTPIMPHLIETAKIVYYEKNISRARGVDTTSLDVDGLCKLLGENVDWTSYAVNHILDSIADPSVYADEISVYIVERIMNINIMIFDRATKKPIARGGDFRRNRPVVALLLEKDVHYDLLALTDGDGYQAIFEWEEYSPEMFNF